MYVKFQAEEIMNSKFVSFVSKVQINEVKREY